MSLEKDLAAPSSEDQLLLAKVETALGHALTLERRVSNRRGAEVLRLQSAEGFTYALKIAGEKEPSIDRERAALIALEEQIGTRLVANGSYEDRIWLLQKWIKGRNLYSEAKHLRETYPTDSTRRLIDLYAAASAYLAAIHAGGHLHGDVQPQHFVVDPQGKMHMLDFGLSHRIRRGHWIRWRDGAFHGPGSL